MKWIADIEAPVQMHFEIEHQILRDVTNSRDVDGYYLYVWKNGQGVHDDLQDDLETAKAAALRVYGLPLSAWREIRESS